MRRASLIPACLVVTVAVGGCAGQATSHRARQVTATTALDRPGAARPGAARPGAARPGAARPGAGRRATRNPATANRPAAQRDMARMLAAVRLPAGAMRASREPRGDNGYLKPGSGRHAWWVVPASSASVIAYLSAHRPPGSTENTHGSGGNLRTGTSSLMVGFSWPPVRGVLSYRELTIIATALPDGRTGVLAEPQSTWIVLRAAGEKVPAGVTAVEVTFKRAAKRLGARHAGPTSRVSIADPATVRRTVRLVDSLGVMQPGAISCTLEGGPTGFLRVRYSAGPAGPALAQAQVTLYAGWGLNGGENECDPISFSVRGHAERALVGAAFIREVTTLAGIRLR